MRIWLVMIALVVARLLWMPTVVASEQPRRYGAETLVLSRLVSLEARSMLSITDIEASMLVHVIRRRATSQGKSTVNVAYRYSVPLRKCRSGVSDDFRCVLGNRNTRPKGFPDNLSWPVYRAAWRHILLLVDSVRASDDGGPCPAATHWAAPWLRPSRNLVRVCGNIETGNVFYTVRRR